MSEKKELTLDPDRVGNSLYHGLTGIYVRAKHGEKWGAFDIAELDEPSLMIWLRSRGGDNPWAEGTVAILLGHEAAGETPEGKADD